MHTRRQFFGGTMGLAGYLSLEALELRAEPLGLPIGFQVFPVREMLGKDFGGTLRQLAAAGYRSVEMCSPPSYADYGFAPLADLKAPEMRQIIQDAGLHCESCHYQFNELKQHLEPRIAFAKELGLKQMILSTFGLGRDATMSDWRRAADELNKIGAEIQKAGLQTGFHNHDFEFKQFDGVLVYDELMSRLDPNLVKMQFQVAVISLGYEAATFFTKYPGRFISAHLADWSSADKKTVAVGKGVVDWKKLFAAAKAGGIKNYFVEVNLDEMKASYPYLHDLEGVKVNMLSRLESRVSEICLAVAVLLWTSSPSLAQKIVVDATPSHMANSFSPLRAFGGAIDRLRAGTGAPSAGDRRVSKEEFERNTDKLLTDPVLKEILGAGWQTVSYRQNTELMVEAWQWNARGAWSNAEKQEGYFTGSAEPTGEMIRHSWAYPLPHRGFSQGDGNGWSRLTDGDLTTYWKSNPYLTRDFTGEDDSLHPQWIMIDLGKKVDINAIRVAWADPYARRYAVQFWTGADEPFYDGTTKGAWQTFPFGAITEGKGGTATQKLVSWMIPVRYLRIWMTESSNTCDTHGNADKRNCVGYAINELYVGTLDSGGRFTDVVKHLPSRKQTVTWPSSVDPWTAAADLDYSRGDQIGFDLFFTSGITRGLPTMVPIAMLYATPEDAAAEIAYLYKRHYPISWIEMGEEADGQHMLPEDYGALYLQFATAIHKLVPEAPLGGPAFEGTFGDVEVWPDANGKVSWLGRFLDYLKAHGRMGDFTFFSFEHYPFQDRRGKTSWSDLYLEPGFVSHVVQAWKDNGLPPNIPFFMTEGNMGGGTGPEDVKSGLWLADYVGSMMTAGAGGTYYFHYMPSPGGRGGFLSLDRDYHVKGYPPQYLASQVITKEWVQPVDKIHRLFRVSGDVKDAAGNLLVTAYAVERPDRQWSVMLINKDHDHDREVKLVFADTESQHDRHFSGKVDRIVFGPAEYQWHGDRASGHADPDGPPSKSTVAGGAETLYQLPKASIIVLRGSL